MDAYSRALSRCMCEGVWHARRDRLPINTMSSSSRFDCFLHYPRIAGQPWVPAPLSHCLHPGIFAIVERTRRPHEARALHMHIHSPLSLPDCSTGGVLSNITPTPC